jgi:hypothetical protein
MSLYLGYGIRLHQIISLYLRRHPSKNLNVMLVKEMGKEKKYVAKANPKSVVTSSELRQVNINLEDKVKRRTSEIFPLSHLIPLTQLVNKKALRP